MQNLLERNKMLILLGYVLSWVLSCAIKHHLYNCVFESSSTRPCIPSLGNAYMHECFLCTLLRHMFDFSHTHACMRDLLLFHDAAVHRGVIIQRHDYVTKHLGSDIYSSDVKSF